MKKKNFNSKLVLKKSTISSLNLNQMRNIIGAAATIGTNPDTNDETMKTGKTTTGCPPPPPPPESNTCTWQIIKMADFVISHFYNYTIDKYFSAIFSPTTLKFFIIELLYTKKNIESLPTFKT